MRQSGEERRTFPGRNIWWLKILVRQSTSTHDTQSLDLKWRCGCQSLSTADANSKLVIDNSMGRIPLPLRPASIPQASSPISSIYFGIMITNIIIIKLLLYIIIQIWQTKLSFFNKSIIILYLHVHAVSIRFVQWSNWNTYNT